MLTSPCRSSGVPLEELAHSCEINNFNKDRNKQHLWPLRGAFSSPLITAQRHWWKGILKLWRSCAVFILSFDYIPNYGASKQLKEAWMWWRDWVCCWTVLLSFEQPTALIFFGSGCFEKERRLMKKGCLWSSKAGLDYKGQ